MAAVRTEASGVDGRGAVCVAQVAVQHRSAARVMVGGGREGRLGQHVRGRGGGSWVAHR